MLSPGIQTNEVRVNRGVNQKKTKKGFDLEEKGEITFHQNHNE